MSWIPTEGRRKDVEGVETQRHTEVPAICLAIAKRSEDPQLRFEVCVHDAPSYSDVAPGNDSLTYAAARNPFEIAGGFTKYYFSTESKLRIAERLIRPMSPHEVVPTPKRPHSLILRP